MIKQAAFLESRGFEQIMTRWEWAAQYVYFGAPPFGVIALSVGINHMYACFLWDHYTLVGTFSTSQSIS